MVVYVSALLLTHKLFMFGNKLGYFRGFCEPNEFMRLYANQWVDIMICRKCTVLSIYSDPVKISTITHLQPLSYRVGDATMDSTCYQSWQIFLQLCSLRNGCINISLQNNNLQCCFLAVTFLDTDFQSRLQQQSNIHSNLCDL